LDSFYLFVVVSLLPNPWNSALLSVRGVQSLLNLTIPYNSGQVSILR